MAVKSDYPQTRVAVALELTNALLLADNKSMHSGIGSSSRPTKEEIISAFNQAIELVNGSRDNG